MQLLAERSEQEELPVVALSAFTIRSSDGIELDALVQRPDFPIGSMLLAHGFSSDLHEEGAFDHLAEHLVDSGIAVLRFSFRGHGKSGGSQTEMTIAGERRDLVAAYDWMKDNLPGPYGMLGASFGGVPATLELAAVRPKPACLALWNPALEIGHVFGRGLVEIAHRRGFVQVNANFKVGLAFIEEREFYHGNLGLQHLGALPALIVHGTQDMQVPLASSIAAATAPQVDLVVLHGAEHGFHEPLWESEAVRVTVGWVEQQFRLCAGLQPDDQHPQTAGNKPKSARNANGWTEYRPYLPLPRMDD